MRKPIIGRKSSGHLRRRRGLRTAARPCRYPCRSCRQSAREWFQSQYNTCLTTKQKQTYPVARPRAISSRAIRLLCRVAPASQRSGTMSPHHIAPYRLRMHQWPGGRHALLVAACIQFLHMATHLARFPVHIRYLAHNVFRRGPQRLPGKLHPSHVPGYESY